MGNICRSPTAHGVFQQYIQEAGLTERVFVDSAGTHAYHIGEPPDPRSQKHALKRGYDLSKQKARQLHPDDFERYNLILVMDWENLALVERQCPPHYKHKLRRVTEFCKTINATVVPDPYYKGDEGFEEVLNLIEDASVGLLDYVKQQL
jgi:protein-tyrosine phosphatase